MCAICYKCVRVRFIPISYLLQPGAVCGGVGEESLEAGPGEEALLHVVVAVHPQGELPQAGQRVGLQQPRDPGVVKRHPARHHLVGPVSDGHSLQLISLQI